MVRLHRAMVLPGGSEGLKDSSGGRVISRGEKFDEGGSSLVLLVKKGI